MVTSVISVNHRLPSGPAAISIGSSPIAGFDSVEYSLMTLCPLPRWGGPPIPPHAPNRKVHATPTMRAVLCKPMPYHIETYSICCLEYTPLRACQGPAHY